MSASQLHKRPVNSKHELLSCEKGIESVRGQITFIKERKVENQNSIDLYIDKLNATIASERSDMESCYQYAANAQRHDRAAAQNWRNRAEVISANIRGLYDVLQKTQQSLATSNREAENAISANERYLSTTTSEIAVLQAEIPAAILRDRPPPSKSGPVTPEYERAYIPAPDTQQDSYSFALPDANPNSKIISSPPAPQASLPQAQVNTDSVPYKIGTSIGRVLPKTIIESLKGESFLSRLTKNTGSEIIESDAARIRSELSPDAEFVSQSMRNVWKVRFGGVVGAIKEWDAAMMKSVDQMHMPEFLNKIGGTDLENKFREFMNLPPVDSANEDQRPPPPQNTTNDGGW